MCIVVPPSHSSHDITLANTLQEPTFRILFLHTLTRLERCVDPFLGYAVAQPHSFSLVGARFLLDAMHSP